MSIFYSHRERFRATGGGSQFALATLVDIAARQLRVLARRVAGRAGAALGIIHRGIVDAKTRRLERELWLHAAVRDDSRQRDTLDSGSDRDAAKFAQRPLLLGDKWDF